MCSKALTKAGSISISESPQRNCPMGSDLFQRTAACGSKRHFFRCSKKRKSNNNMANTLMENQSVSDTQTKKAKPLLNQKWMEEFAGAAGGANELNGEEETRTAKNGEENFAQL